MTRALVYRTLGLGDFLTAVPAYRAVARAFPSYELVLAAPEPLRPLAALCTAVDTFLPSPELSVPAWSGPPPDVAVNLHGAGPQSHAVLAGMRPGRLVAFGNAGAGVYGPAWCLEEHEVSRWCRLLRESGIEADPSDLLLPVPGERSRWRGATVVHPGAADPARRWPADRFASVAAALAADGHEVVVTGVESERVLADSVARAAGLAADRVLAGRLGLGAMAALVAAAQLVVCGDTGVAHLASAFRTPSVLLFGPMSPALWGSPADRPEHRVLWAGPVAAAAPRRSGGPHPALLEIGVDDVLAATHAATAHSRDREGQPAPKGPVAPHDHGRG